MRTPPADFKVDVRVCRRLRDKATKLEYVYAGPYRVAEVLGDGRYRLRDLENKIMREEFDASNLRKYRVLTDAVDLTSDEYLVDELLRLRQPEPLPMGGCIVRGALSDDEQKYLYGELLGSAAADSKDIEKLHAMMPSTAPARSRSSTLARCSEWADCDPNPGCIHSGEGAIHRHDAPWRTRASPWGRPFIKGVPSDCDQGFT